MSTPVWQSPTTGQPTLAAHVNQFLTIHPSQLLYAATRTSSQTTAGVGNVSTNNTWLAQSFTTGASQTAVGYVTLQLGASTSSGSLLPPTTVSIYTNSAGAPGTALVSTTVTAEFAFQGPLNLPIPVPVTGLSVSTQYWIVVKSSTVGTGNYSLNKSNQVSGASTSPNGTAWTAQAFGFLYQVFDQTASGTLTFNYSDSGARWVWYSYNTNGSFHNIAEFTAGQTTAGYLQSFRTAIYPSNILNLVF